MVEYKEPEIELVKVIDVIKTSEIVEEPFEPGDNPVENPFG